MAKLDDIPGTATAMVDFDTPEPQAPPRRTCRVLVAYEDGVGRVEAYSIWRHAAGRLPCEFGLDFDWLGFSSLNDPEILHDSARVGSEADVILFCADAGGVFSPAVKAWNEAWLAQRVRRDGCLVVMLGDSVNLNPEASLKLDYLKGIARRAGMDFLADCVGAKSGVSSPAETIMAWANEVPHGFAQILEQSAQVSRWGLNE